jgi:hypothetical protein
MVIGVVDYLLACLGETVVVRVGNMAGPCDIGTLLVPNLPWSGYESPASIARVLYFMVSQSKRPKSRQQ